MILRPIQMGAFAPCISFGRVCRSALDQRIMLWVFLDCLLWIPYDGVLLSRYNAVYMMLV